jgi:hypothetical protein
VQLGEALKEGGGRRKKKNVDEARVCSCELDEAMVKGTECYPLSDDGSSSLVPESDQGFTLEVVLPICQSTPKSGLGLLQQGSHDEVSQQRCDVVPESSKLLN